ncbi:uncharacterized protein [Lolium perenne]|uniref:uncharacterized protein n=1 Tax=Lolium perenne TaxID=4522 RepID=UPI0021F641C4|nr:uncharacterized protein LOC127347832 [Lolium perenne]
MDSGFWREKLRRVWDAAARAVCLERAGSVASLDRQIRCSTAVLTCLQHIRRAASSYGHDLRASPVVSPKPIWGAPDKKTLPAASPKLIFVRRALIRCPAPRARPRPTGDAPGTLDTTKSEAKRGGPDASAARKPKTPSPTFGQATLMTSMGSQTTQGRVSSCMAAWPSAPALLRATTRCRRCTFKDTLRFVPISHRSQTFSSPPPPLRIFSSPLQTMSTSSSRKIAAMNAFGRGSLTVLEAWALYHAGYPVPPDMRLPSSGGGWKMAVNGIGVLPPPKSGTEQWRDGIKAQRVQFTSEERADPTWVAKDNNDWWVTYFKAKYDVEMHITTGLIGGPSSWNRDGRTLFWGIPRRTLDSVIRDIRNGAPRLETPPSPVTVTVSSRRTTAMAAEQDHVLVLLELFSLWTGPIDAVLVVPLSALHRPQTRGEGGAGDARQHEACRQRQPTAAREAWHSPPHPEARGEGGVGGSGAGGAAGRVRAAAAGHRQQ